MPSRTTAVALAVGLVAALGGVLAGVRLLRPQVEAVESGVLLQAPRPLPEFRLTDATGAPFTRESLQGSWSILFAGFMNCPDVCPLTLGVLKAADATLRAEGVEVRTVFLSVDPERDTPGRMAPYVAHFSPHFTGATGDLAELRKLCDALGLAFVKVPGATDADYTVDHTAALALIDPQGRLAGYFTPPLQADALARDLARIAGRS